MSLEESPFSLRDRLALVTGGSRGIGFAIAEAFVSAGARVIVTARSEEGVRAAAGRLGPNALGFTCDNADPAQVERTVAEAWRFGGLDILVNNAGISPFYKRAEQVEPAEFDQVTTVNLRGTYFFSTAVAKCWFEEGRKGCVINISSTLASVPGDRLAVYSAIKAGINQMTRALALEWADRGVRVNAIAPGWTETDFTEGLFASRHAERLLADIPLGRWARTADVTGAAVYLASAASDYVTGTILVVDGGRALR